MAALTDRGVSDEAKRRFAVASNSLHLIAGKRAVDALDAFRYEISAGNRNKSDEAHDRLLSRLFWEIRRDLGEVPTEDAADFRIRFYESGVGY